MNFLKQRTAFIYTQILILVINHIKKKFVILYDLYYIMLHAHISHKKMNRKRGILSNSNDLDYFNKSR